MLRKTRPIFFRPRVTSEHVVEQCCPLCLLRRRVEPEATNNFPHTRQGRSYEPRPVPLLSAIKRAAHRLEHVSRLLWLGIANGDSQITQVENIDTCSHGRFELQCKRYRLLDRWCPRPRGVAAPPGPLPFYHKDRRDGHLRYHAHHLQVD